MTRASYMGSARHGAQPYQLAWFCSAAVANFCAAVDTANYQFGSIILIILDALWVAMQTGCEALTQQHFSEAYETRAACEDAFNPFIVTDYHKIDTSRVFTRAAE